MKNLLSRKTLAVGLTILIFFTLSSCLKNNNSEYIAPPTAGVSIFHASPGTAKFNVAIGTTIINNGYYTISFEYPKALQYVGVTPGSRKFTFLKNGTNDTIRTGTYNIVKDKYYSLFLVDEAPSPNLLLVQDTIVSPIANNARVRFINLSPDAGNLDLIANSGTDTLLFSNINYKTATAFINLPGTKAYKFEIKSSGTSKGIIENVEIKSNNFYTVWAKGVSTATVDSLKTGVKVNQHVDYYR